MKESIQGVTGRVHLQQSLASCHHDCCWSLMATGPLQVVTRVDCQT